MKLAAWPATVASVIAASVVSLAEVKRQMDALSFGPAPTTPEEYDRILRGLIKTFTRVAQEAGLKPR